MSEFNFKSQICTSREQSERLLALGLKKETADCYLFEYDKEKYKVIAESWLDLIADEKYYSQYKDVCFPAWSLGRLVEDLMPQTVTYRLNKYYLSLNLGEGMIGYFPPRLSARLRPLNYFYGNDTILYDCISCIEWLIKEGYFNREYLV